MTLTSLEVSGARVVAEDSTVVQPVFDGRSAWRIHSRAGLGLSPTPKPGLLLLPIGLALGPSGLNLLTEHVLSSLDPVLSVAVAALGVFAGFGLDLHRRRDSVLLAAASVEAGVSVALVFGGLLFLTLYSASALRLSWVVSLLLGVCAGASSTTVAEQGDRPASSATRVGDLDDVLPIVAGSLAIALVHGGSLRQEIWLLLQSALISGCFAVAGWLLIARASPGGEQHVFVVGTLLLVGGGAAYLTSSALLAGLMSGLIWAFVGGAASDCLRLDLQHVQRPLVVLLLVVAGARLRISTDLVLLAAIFVMCRFCGKLAGGRLAAVAIGRGLPPNLGRRLVSPGVLAVAFALSLRQAGLESSVADLVLGVAVVGSLASELLSTVVYPRDDA